MPDKWQYTKINYISTYEKWMTHKWNQEYNSFDNSNKKEYLGIYLTKEMQDLHSENY